MTKKPTPDPAPIIDVRLEMAILRSAGAPVIYFDGFSTSGVYGGMANITLICGLHTIVDGKNINGPRDVAHLRFPVAAVAPLRHALQNIENALRPISEKLKN